MRDENRVSLLGAKDAPPVELINTGSEHPLLLVCEHAGNLIPAALGDLGIAEEDRGSHACLDIGIEKVTRLIAEATGAPAILQNYSRLVIDCNRPPDAIDAMPALSHGVHAPGNRDLDTAARAARITEIFDPYQRAIRDHLERHPRRLVVSMHSFTPSLAGESRPWHIGFLFRQDVLTSGYLARFMAEARPDLLIGMNQPYTIDDESDWFVPQHGERSGLPHSLVEIRNDLITTAEGQQIWADLMVDALDRYLKEV